MAQIVINTSLKWALEDFLILSAAEFFHLQDETPSFNECEHRGENLLIIGSANNHDIDEKEENQEGEPSRLYEVLNMVCKLHLLVFSQHPDLHQ